MKVYPWREVEIVLVTNQEYENPYTEIDGWVEFLHDSGTRLIRPAFWDGEKRWKVRFASPLDYGVWKWKSYCSQHDCGIDGQTGELVCEPGEGSEHRFYKHGFWKMSPGGRSLIHADGYPAVLVADTAWGLPWRATPEQCAVYAADRHQKGFNAVLLMSIQPDMHAVGPRDRTKDEGFGVAFEDLKDGHIKQINPSYFQYLDALIDILVEHEIVPVWQPVFHGFGWKGLKTAGSVVPPEEYARYCRYIVARYGARPAIYLVGGDGSGYDPQVAAGGSDIQLWDCYRQATGIHYRPHADNCAWQDQEWLDFQWCQTGHIGEHIPERVADMWRNRPIKAVANGEPSYENTGQRGHASGWWQGHEAWCNLCAGGTMGVVYGAGSLWQWCLHANEPGQSPYFLAPDAGWQEALYFEGSKYVGLVGKILEDLPTTDMEPNWQFTLGRRGLWVPDKLFIAYQENGGSLMLMDKKGLPRNYKIVDPKTGQIITHGKITESDEEIHAPDGVGPCLYMFYQEENRNEG